MISLDENQNLLISKESGYTSENLFLQLGFVTADYSDMAEDQSTFIPIKVNIEADCSLWSILVYEDLLKVKVIRNSEA